MSLGGILINPTASTRFNPSKRFAVIIGSNYVGSKLQIYQLQGCENDAIAVSDILSASGYTSTLLLGAEATHHNITNAINRASTGAGIEGLLIIYFAGASTRDLKKDLASGFIPQDIDVDTLSNAIPLGNLIRSLLDTVKRVVVIVDTCNFGHINVPGEFLIGETCVVLAATELGQRANEYMLGGKIRGVFTYWLVDHWKNYPGAVDINSLFSSVTQALEKSEMSTPVLSGVQTGRIILRPALSLAEVQEKQPPPPPATATTKPLVIADAKVTGEVKRSLVTVMAAAFPTRAYLDELCDFNLGKTLDTIPTEGNDIPDLIRSVVNWCLIQGGNTLGALLAGALKARPKRDDLRHVVESLVDPDTPLNG